MVALASCVGRIGDGADVDAPTWSPAAATLSRLTGKQYRSALVDLLGPDLPATPVQPDTNPYLFYSIGAASTPLSELGVQQIEEAAEAVTAHVFSDPARRSALVGCEPAAPGDACVASFLASFGRRAFRRPLSSVERSRWLGVATDLADGDAWLGVRTAVAGMLQAPSFLYRAELGEADPDDPSRARYTGWEMAGRLSFLFWNTTPDGELLDAAGRGDLDTTEGIEAQARRLLADPRARDAVQDFFAQYFDLGRLDGISRDPATYPQFTATMPASMRTEVKLLVDDFVNRRDADIRGIFSTRRTFVNSELAALYGVKAEGASPIAFVPVELPADGPRAGMLTLGAFLAMNAHETDTSPTLRGKYVRERVLCLDVPPPPPGVVTTISQDPTEPKTLRERLEQHRKNPTCAGCHSLIDPPGFLFEHFDSSGAYRTTEHGYPIDATGSLDGKALDGARDLAEILVDHPMVGRCVVKQLYRHAQGRLDTSGESVAIDELRD
ncbi:MAG: DUF1592 domain-containing protein [Minicystis sp.]